MRISDRGELGDLAKTLRVLEDGKAIRRGMVREIRAAARPAQAAVKSAYQAGPSQGRGSTGLRRDLAKATTLTVRTSGRKAGATLSVKGRKMGDGRGRLPKLYEGTAAGGRWRHPLFGDREWWFQQRPRPTFYRAVRPYARIVERKVYEVATDVAQSIAGKGNRV